MRCLTPPKPPKAGNRSASPNGTNRSASGIDDGYFKALLEDALKTHFVSCNDKLDLLASQVDCCLSRLDNFCAEGGRSSTPYSYRSQGSRRGTTTREDGVQCPSLSDILMMPPPPSASALRKASKPVVVEPEQQHEMQPLLAADGQQEDGCSLAVHGNRVEGSFNVAASKKWRSAESVEMQRRLEISNQTENVIAELLGDPESSKRAFWYSRARNAFILCTVSMSILFTHPVSIFGQPLPIAAFEGGIEVAFLVEWLARVISKPTVGNSLGFLSIIDLFSFLPLAFRAAEDFQVCDEYRNEDLMCNVLICAVPVFRLLKILRNFRQMSLLQKAFKQALEALPVLMFTMCIIVLAFSAIIYIVEPRSNISSLPRAIWFCLVSMTTVGYGDMVPVSGLGYLIVSALILTSVLYMAMPLGIIGFAFTTVWNDRDRVLLIERTREKIFEWGYSHKDIHKIFQLFDEDGGGNVELDEFRAIVKKLQLGLDEERVVDLFNTFDVDGDGTVDEKEFLRALFPREFAEASSWQLEGSEKRSGSKLSQHILQPSMKDPYG